ncbi:MAG: hypothetical protein ACYDHY_17435 [Acidiferrobacterales bacterium]
MASLALLRTGLQTRLQTIAGLRCYDVVPDQAQLPAAIVMLKPPLRYDQSMGGTAIWQFTVTLLVSRWDAARAQHAIDPYIDTTGAQSVHAAIEADRTLGGACDDATVQQVTNYGPATYAGVQYLAVEWLIEAITSS